MLIVCYKQVSNFLKSCTFNLSHWVYLNWSIRISILFILTSSNFKSHNFFKGQSIGPFLRNSHIKYSEWLVDIINKESQPNSARTLLFTRLHLKGCFLFFLSHENLRFTLICHVALVPPFVKSIPENEFGIGQFIKESVSFNLFQTSTLSFHAFDNHI